MIKNYIHLNHCVLLLPRQNHKLLWLCGRDRPLPGRGYLVDAQGTEDKADSFCQLPERIAEFLSAHTCHSAKNDIQY